LSLAAAISANAVAPVGGLVLTREGDSTAYSKELDVPAGTYELKVAINKSWDES